MGSLALANPWLVWGLLAAGVPVLIHLLSRRRARQVAFAAVEFILRSRQQKARSVRLRQILLLLARTALVAAVALAILRPMLQPKAAAAAQTGPAATAIVLDASLSMRWKDGATPLFDRARAEAKSLLDALPAEAPATLLVCDGTAPEAEPPGFDRAAIARRLAAAQAGWRPADVTACTSAAARALGSSPLKAFRVYVLGDLTSPSIRLDAPAPRVPTPTGEVAPEVVFIDAARDSPMPNLAVTDVHLAPSAALGTRGFEITATVRNSGDRPAENAPVSLRAAGRVLVRGFVDVPAHASARKVLAHRFDAGTILADVALEPDALAEDDVRAFVLRVPRDVRALVVDGAPAAVRQKDEAFFVDAALGPGRTGGRIAATFLDADAARSRPLEPFDVVLLLNLPAPAPAWASALRAFVERGGGLFLSGGDNVVPDDWNAAFGELLPRPLHLVRTTAEPGETSGPPPARFARVDFAHPALSLFEGADEGFETARVFRHVLLQPDARRDERVLAWLDDGSPAIIEARRGLGRVVFYTSTVDRDWTDWPIRTSFLPAIQQLVAYLAGGLDEKPPAPSSPGDERTLDVPPGARVETVTGPDGKPARVEETRVKVAMPGHHAVVLREGAGTRDAPELAFAAVLDTRETDTTRIDPKELERHFGGEAQARIADDASGALPKSGTPLWSWLLVAAIAAFLTEGVLVRRG